MKKLVVLIVILSFAISLMPAFAAEKTKSASEDTETKSFFQQASDDISKITMSASGKSPTKIFQESSDIIGAGSPAAKADSLRGHKSELKRRRMGKNIIMI